MEFYYLGVFFDEKSTLEIPTLIGLKVALNVRLASLCHVGQNSSAVPKWHAEAVRKPETFVVTQTGLKFYFFTESYK